MGSLGSGFISSGAHAFPLVQGSGFSFAGSPVRQFAGFKVSPMASPVSQRIDVGVLGATGMVGQQFISLLADHPWFRPSWLAASERSEGKLYRDAASWRLPEDAPASIGGVQVEGCIPGRGPRLIFSALDANAAKDIEPEFARAGHIIITNARSFRMDAAVPLLIPEINGDHLALTKQQKKAHGWSGTIVTNPNCSTVV